MAASCHLALGWASNLPVVTEGGLLTSVWSASLQTQGLPESMWADGQDAGFLSLVVPETCSVDMGESLPLSEPLLPCLSNEGLERVTPSSLGMLSFS